jgi:RsiW-degrading membrane proteinase PrsW (M82 family)
MLLPLLSALIPAIALLGYIYWRDRKSPEPVKQLLKATAWGVLSIPLTLCIVNPLQSVGLIVDDAYTFADAINISFLGAAIPEELSKLFVLWLFLRKNPFFDERMDGIVYAVCVSLGFAGLENFMYVIGDADWMSVALTRAFTAVPGHFCFGVIMGYFYSLAKFGTQKKRYYSAMALIAPIVAHGIYDTIAFTVGLNISVGLSVMLMLLFLVFCFYLWKWAAKSIKRHVEK